VDLTYTRLFRPCIGMPEPMSLSRDRRGRTRVPRLLDVGCRIRLRSTPDSSIYPRVKPPKWTRRNASP
jgi:hypothetical protein